MTRPIYEPSTQRSGAYLDFQDQQLFQRPAPTSAGTLPWARISKGFDATDQVISNNTNTDLTFNHDYNMAAGESGETFFATSGTTGLTALVHGLHLVTVQAFWASTLANTWMLAITDSDDWFHGNYFATQTSQDMFGLVTQPIRLKANTTLFPTVWQQSGGTRNVSASYLEMVYMGDYTGTERIDSLPYE